MSNGPHRGPGRPPKAEPAAAAPASIRVQEAISAQAARSPSPQDTFSATEFLTCASCRFYRTKGKAGECRRFPPVPGFGDFLFPITHETMWCGEHQAR